MAGKRRFAPGSPRLTVGSLSLLSQLGALFIGCHRVAGGPHMESIDGVHFGAIAKLTGDARSTLDVRVWATNHARAERRIEEGGCPGIARPLEVRLYSAATHNDARATWSSQAVERADVDRLQARHDTTPAGRPLVYAVCLPVAYVRIL